MATQEITKYSVYDPRIIQERPQFAAEKGAASISNTSFNAQTANSSSQQFQITVPSENVFIDRAVDWTCSGVVSFPITLNGVTTAGAPLCIPGVDISLAAFPSHQCVNTMTASINDATVAVVTADVLNYVLRLQDLARNRKQRTTPTMLDIYAYTPSVANYPNSPMAGYGQRYEADQFPNGSYAQYWFCDSTGAILPTGAAGTQNGTSYVNGIPCVVGTVVAYTLYVKWQSTEKLLLPPFIFGDDYELSTGLFGVQNFSVTMNMQSNPSRAIRLASTYLSRQVGSVGTAIVGTVGTVSWATSINGAYAPYGFQPALSVQFLTPPTEVPLPPKSIVPYMDFTRYITTGLGTINSTLGTTASSAKNAVSGTTITSNSFTIPVIPDLLLIYTKPSAPYSTLFNAGTNVGTNYTVGTAGTCVPYINAGSTWDSTFGDFSLPIQSVSLTFDNFSGLLANHTQAELYKMSVANGLEMDYSEWIGEGRSSGGLATGTAAVGSTPDKSVYVSLVGGPLVLRPGRDFALQTGQAAGLVGNFNFQVQVTLGNQFLPQLMTGAVNLYVVGVSSGFFETIKGSSRIIKGVLTEQDILSAPPHAPEPALERLVGEGRHHSGPSKRGKKALHQYT